MNATSIAVLVTTLEMAEPSRPSSGAPQWPKTKIQFPSALMATAMPVIAVPMPGRPSVATTVRRSAASTIGIAAHIRT